MKNLKKWDINNVFDYFRGLYSKRNATYLDKHKVQILLFAAVGNLSRAIRKEKPQSEIARKLGEIFVWIYSLIEVVGNPDAVQGLCRKFPNGKCGYCQYTVCRCGPGRKSHQLVLADTIDPNQTLWTLKDWTKKLSHTYGSMHRKAGINFALNRIYEEINEAIASYEFDDLRDESVTLDRRREKMLLEFADAVSWVFSLAGLLKVDLEEALLKVYKDGCPTCHENPCNCTHVQTIDSLV